jgi:hypothetical protein
MVYVQNYAGPYVFVADENTAPRIKAIKYK